MIGGTSSDGRSGLSVRIGLARNQGLISGERLFGARTLAVAGAAFVAGVGPRVYVPVGGGVNVVSLGDGPLTLKPEFGGTPLGSPFTSFSTSGFNAAEAIANAGRLDLEPASDAFGARQSLVTGTVRRSLILSARREVGAVEGFLDYLYLDNRGHATVPAGDAVLGPIGARSPYNPFEQTVVVSRSVPWDGVVRNRSFTQRLDVGLIVRLPAGWTAEGDLSRSESLVRVVNAARGASIYADLSVLVGDGVFGPDLTPFAAQDDFLAAYRAYQLKGGSFLKFRDRLDDVNLRASGPLWRLPGGPLTMTILAEARRETAPAGLSEDYDYLTGEARSLEGNRLRLSTRSAYAEWRAPLTSPDAPAPFRGLELQVALRADDYRMTAPQSNEGVSRTTFLTDVIAKHLVVARTVGVKTFVRDGVMLRGSYSEGHLPPRSDQLQPRVISWNSPLGLQGDPKRGGQIIGTDKPFLFVTEGSPDLLPELARTFSMGVVVQPPDLTGLRLSLDYLRTEKHREITGFASGDIDYFLRHEARYPGRVVRAPLTDADRAKGYAAGAIIRIDTSDLNVGRSVAETVSASAEYAWSVGGGEAAAYLRAVWQPSYRRRADPEAGWTETVGYGDGPLRVRAFAGGQWSRGGVTAGMSAQYYASYRIEASGFDAGPIRDVTVTGQAKGRVRPQVYFDAFSRWSVGGSGRTQIQLLARNLLDGKPPLALAAAMGYSPYGDARGRSFEISLARRF
jgi:hypothetical protein